MTGVESPYVTRARETLRRAREEAWAEGYNAGDLDADVARSRSMGYEVPEDTVFPTPNPYAPEPVTSQREPSNPDLWR